MREIESQSQQMNQPIQIQNNSGQPVMGSSLAEGGSGENSEMTAYERNLAGPSFLPAAERSRASMQLEEMSERPLTVAGFMNQEDDEDEDCDKLGESQDGLLQWEAKGPLCLI